jgi:histone acetyltransferase (RNA polymerase elongator complex component)
MKRVIVPFFIAHQGCPFQCVFCDQVKITGVAAALPTAAEIESRVADWLASSGVNKVEVAFYGGTFTALPQTAQQALLEPLQPLLASGAVTGIRVSTRPDCITSDSVTFLRQHGVDLVELGVQSMDDGVLAASGRGHDAAATVNAFAILKSGGLKVGAQLLPGLPGANRGEAVATFRRVIALKPDILRIYPAVILKATGLAKKYQQGSYLPLSLDEAVQICKLLLHEAAQAGVPVIRVGLQPTEDIAEGAELLAGPFHPAFRQLVESERWFDLLQRLLKGFDETAALNIRVAAARVADVTGQKRSNIRRLAGMGRMVAAVTAAADLDDNQIEIIGGSMHVSGNLLTDLDYR